MGTILFNGKQASVICLLMQEGSGSYKDDVACDLSLLFVRKITLGTHLLALTDSLVNCKLVVHENDPRGFPRINLVPLLFNNKQASIHCILMLEGSACYKDNLDMQLP